MDVLMQRKAKRGHTALAADKKQQSRDREGALGPPARKSLRDRQKEGGEDATVMPRRCRKRTPPRNAAKLGTHYMQSALSSGGGTVQKMANGTACR